MNIEKDIPLPKYSTGRFAAPVKTIPFDAMEIGDSVLVPHGFEGSTNAYSLAKVGAHRHGKATGRAYTIRKEEGGTRIWRTK